MEQYWTFDHYIPPHLTGSIYARYGHAEAPNPCRKYHVSAHPECAGAVAEEVLPRLHDARLAHKVVGNHAQLLRQDAGLQAGKFITIYAPASPPHPGHCMPILLLADFLASGLRQGRFRPADRVPRYRPSAHLFIEAPVEGCLMLFGGFEADPAA